LIYSIYIIYSNSKDQFYIGHTQDVSNRLKQHNNGYSKSTKFGIPWKLLHVEHFDSRSAAIKREYEIKSKKSRKYLDWIINQ
jgi:putative endonuclease